MTPQLVDHAHTESCAVIGCNLVQPRRKVNMFISGRSHTTVTIVNKAIIGLLTGHQTVCSHVSFAQ